MKRSDASLLRTPKSGFVLLTVLALIDLELAASAQGLPVQTAIDLKRKITLTARGTRLQRVLTLAVDMKIPVGIVTKDLNLCSPREPRVYTGVELGKILDSVLSDSGYAWHLKDSVLHVRPSSGATPIASRVLLANLSSFGGMATTIQGLGMLLSNKITVILHPGQGYIGHITASLDAENIPPFVLHDVTVQDAADFIVSRASKGAWILYPTGEADVNLRTFGYKDDGNVLRNTSCIGEPQ